ncbi:cysteine hydrolase family protein [Paracoccus yeei]|nr:cysteine hydrolase [Paracoccus yeei]
MQYGGLGPETLHLCVDMQQIFAPGSPWAVPWIERILPAVVALVEASPARTLFTRFIPPERPGDARGAWARYYAAWPMMLRQNLDLRRLDLLPALSRHSPPARVLDKAVYSPWHDGSLHWSLHRAGITALVVSGGETDVCLLATVLGAVDLGYRVVLVADATCSSTDQGHEAAMALYRHRFSHQIETAELEQVLDAWRPG